MIIGNCPVCGAEMRVGTDMTNADRIRAMTDEELAEWIAGDALNLTGGALAMATEAWLDWLKQEAQCTSE